MAHNYHFLVFVGTTTTFFITIIMPSVRIIRYLSTEKFYPPPDYDGKKIPPPATGKLSWIASEDDDPASLVKIFENNKHVDEMKNIPFRRRPREIMSFDSHFAELAAFISENGHCNIPPGTSKCNSYRLVSLRNWCYKMRSTKRKMDLNQKTDRSLTEDEIRKLTTIGFKWHSQRKGKDTFASRFRELMQYKAKFGHCRIPTNRHDDEYRSLAMWCRKVRWSRRRTQHLSEEDGKDFKHGIMLSEQKVKLLTDAGFSWEFKNGAQSHFD